MELGAQFYGLDALPGANKQKYTLGITISATIKTPEGEGTSLRRRWPKLPALSAIGNK